jgi:hypothetical protein
LVFAGEGVCVRDLLLLLMAYSAMFLLGGMRRWFLGEWKEETRVLERGLVEVGEDYVCVDGALKSVWVFGSVGGETYVNK